MHQSRSMTREIGTAFAVLAIYLLTILAPLHHARASQLVFEDLGYATLESGWVLCTPAATGERDGDITVSKCPAAGVGKPDMVAPSVDFVALNLSAAYVAAPLSVAITIVTPMAIAPPSGPRAPPVRV